MALVADALVVLNAQDAHVLRTLLPQREKVYLDSLSLSPNGRTVYLERLHKGGDPRVLAVSVADGSATVIARGSSPTLSPDGRKIALLRRATPDEFDASLIVVRSLRTGAERVWRREKGRHIGGMYFGGWFPNSERFLFGECGVDTCSLSGIVDMRARGTVLRRSSIGAVNKRGIRTWHFAVPRTKNSLAVAAKNWSDGYSSTRVEDVDAVTMTRNEAIIMTTNKDLSLLDFDRSGRHLVAIGRPHARYRTVVLFRWHGGQLIRVATGVDEAVW